MSDARAILGSSDPGFVVTNIAELPVRMKTPEVLGITRYSIATLRRRQKQGRFPRPVEPGIYRRDDVLVALGLKPGGSQ